MRRLLGAVRRLFGRLRRSEIAYRPRADGRPDPGEVVWTWVPFEEDASQGKDRPVVLIGAEGAALLGVPLTSKQPRSGRAVAVGRGAWDREGRPSWAKVDQVLRIDPEAVRREGCALDRRRFRAVVDAALSADR